MDDRKRLVDASLSEELAAVVFSESHGAFDDHLGAGLLYYTLATMLRSQVSVCIGSGGGFVPRLLYQAQRDLGVSNAQTYLIDANLPDLAFGSPVDPGGWLMPGNPLQGIESGLTILRMLSADAAKLFALHGISIDYLHIDGDHSRRGVLLDLADYLPLLSSVSVVTFHDLRLKSVAQALDRFMAEHDQLELLSFPEVGNGTGVLRKKAKIRPPALGITGVDIDRPVRRTLLPAEAIGAAVARSQHKSRFERWHYLATPAYRLRYELIRGIVDVAGATIVEIGGYPNSIVGVLTAARRVVAIEPYLPPDFIEEIRARAESRNIELVLSSGSVGKLGLDLDMLAPYTLVALGLDISSACETREDFARAFASLVKLALGANLIALELPGFEPSEITFQALTACIDPTVLHDITIDLTKDPVADEYFVKDARARRRLVVLTPGRVVPGQALQTVIDRTAARLAAIKEAAETPRGPDYAFGELIEFRSGTDAARVLAGGWGRPEKEFVWATRRQSRLRLDVSGVPEAAETVLLRAAFRPFAEPRKPVRQSLAIAVNGREVFDQVLERSQTVAIRLPRELFNPGSITEILLAHPDGLRPSDVIPGSADGRVLSVALCSLQLTVPA